MTDTTARRALYLALMTDGITGRGHSPDRSEQATALIEAFRDEVLAKFAQNDARELLARHRDQILTEAIEPLRVRLWLIEQHVARITSDDDPVGIAFDLTPYLDGPIHPDHVAAYRAACTDPVEICEIPHLTIAEEDACEKQLLTARTTTPQEG